MKALLLLLGLSLAMAANAAASKPPVRGHFTLVVAGSVDMPIGQRWGNSQYDTAPARIQPFTIPGFTSFQACVGAGLEMQARFRSDGYALDFVCSLVSP